MHDERKLGWGNDQNDDIKWCQERGYRAYVAAAPGVFSPGLLLARDTQVVGVASLGDTLVYDGKLISIRVGD